MDAERGNLVLVHRGTTAVGVECAQAAALLVRRARPDLRIRFTGPSDVPLTAAVLAEAVLYVQPGGGTLRRAWRGLHASAGDVRTFVEDGGAYLGFCLGAYLAGRTPGFGLFAGDTDRYAGSPGAEVGHTRDTVLEVSWRGRPRRLFFQDGPRLLLDDPAPAGVEVLARYRSGAVAALAQSTGRGRVVLVGPHPEATPDWYGDAGIRDTDPERADLGRDLLASLLGHAPGTLQWVG